MSNELTPGLSSIVCCARPIGTLRTKRKPTEEAAADGCADYVLKDSRSRPLAVIEAKRFSIDPYAAKDQARAYAQSLPVHFVILSNGHDHYFWDFADGDARPVFGLPTIADLERRANLKQHRKGSLIQSLAAVPYPTRFRFKGEEISPYPYQLECLRAADAALAAGTPPHVVRDGDRHRQDAGHRDVDQALVPGRYHLAGVVPGGSH